jgi:hypothetical protein
MLGVLYFWWVLRSNSPAGLAARLPWVASLARDAEKIGAVTIAAGALASWMFGKPRPRLVFTDAEVHFLFAAPLTRRQVVHFRLVKALLQAVVPAAVATVFAGRTAAFGVAAWLAFATLELHAMGASFARARLHERATGLRLRVAQIVGIVLAAAVVGGVAASGASLTSGPSAWLLWPARVLVRPALAEGVHPFLLALAPALLVLALHYTWVLGAAVRFEDAAVEGAERLARRLESVRAGGGTALLASGRARPVPFRLPRSASPEVALAWKGLIGIGRSLALRIFAVVVPLTLATAVGAFLGGSGPDRPIPSALGVLAAILLLVVAMIPFRGGGLAGDIGRLDFLRALPLSGARIVLGQALSPALLLAAVWLVLVPPASFLFPADLDALERSCLGLTLAVVGPPALLLGVLLQASVVVVVPGWAATGAGPLAVGQSMLSSVVHLVGLPILLVPAALTMIVLVAVGRPLIGWVAVPAAGAATAAVLAAEIALALLVAGRAFERLDPSDL